MCLVSLHVASCKTRLRKTIAKQKWPRARTSDATRARPHPVGMAATARTTTSLGPLRSPAIKAARRATKAMHRCRRGRGSCIARRRGSAIFRARCTPTATWAGARPVSHFFPRLQFAVGKQPTSVLDVSTDNDRVVFERRKLRSSLHFFPRVGARGFQERQPSRPPRALPRVHQNPVQEEVPALPPDDHLRLRPPRPLPHHPQEARRILPDRPPPLHALRRPRFVPSLATLQLSGDAAMARGGQSKQSKRHRRYLPSHVRFFPRRTTSSSSSRRSTRSSTSRAGRTSRRSTPATPGSA